MTAKLDLLLTLERVMLDLDEVNDPMADRVRDLMDPIWYGLSAAERAILDARDIDQVRLLNPIRLAAGSEFFITPVSPVVNSSTVNVREGLRVPEGWEEAA